MSNWWASKLQGDARPAPRPNLPSSPVTRQTYQPAPVPQPAPVAQESCPSCHSANYTAPTGTRMKRCFDCGYPVEQSGSGVGGVGSPQSDGSVKKATQVDSGGYNPTAIVGRVE